MKYVEVKFTALPKKVRKELNVSDCGGWIEGEHEADDLHFVVSANEIVTENNVMIFCTACLADFWKNKPAV